MMGCYTPESRSDLPLTDAAAFSGGDGVEFAERWWIAFDDDALNQRVDSALANNFDLAAAWQRLAAARALARRTASDRFPELDGTGGVGRDESLTSGDDRTEIRLGLAASYEVDLWGRIDSLVEAEALRAQATEADYKAAAISLSSSVTLTWYQLAEVRQQLALVQSQLDVNQTFLELLRERFNVGLIRSVDVVRQQQLVEATREQAIVLHAQREVLEHQLAILDGKPPQSAGSFAEVLLPDLPASPKTSLPATLLQRRPDVLAAYLRLQAADEDLAAAVSDQYPRLNLSASLETIAERPSDLFEDWLFSIAGQAVAPLLDGGERRAEVQRNEAVIQQRIAEYGQVVLNAFGEVEDALVQESRQAQRLASLNEQLRLADNAVEQLRTQFLNGVGDYLAVLTALQDKQQLERDVVSARLDLIAFRIALYRALAGGFETPLEQESVEPKDEERIVE
ncbi:MAG: efflux transporter outer membrane subunit [Phycisphaeraceae bacterium]